MLACAFGKSKMSNFISLSNFKFGIMLLLFTYCHQCRCAVEVYQ